MQTVEETLFLIRHPRPWSLGPGGVYDRDGSPMDLDLAMEVAVGRMNALDASADEDIPTWIEPVLAALCADGELGAHDLLVSEISTDVVLRAPGGAGLFANWTVMIRPIPVGWLLDVRSPDGGSDVGAVEPVCDLEDFGPVLRAVLERLERHLLAAAERAR